VSGFHICNPPAFFAMIFPIAKVFMGERLKQRLRVHAGSDEHVLGELEKFGMTKDMLPTDIGGNISVDHEGWLQERKACGL
jgi:hypothetical protein